MWRSPLMLRVSLQRSWLYLFTTQLLFWAWEKRQVNGRVGRSCGGWIGSVWSARAGVRGARSRARQPCVRSCAGPTASGVFGGPTTVRAHRSAPASRAGGTRRCAALFLPAGPTDARAAGRRMFALLAATMLKSFDAATVPSALDKEVDGIMGEGTHPCRARVLLELAGERVRPHAQTHALGGGVRLVRGGAWGWAAQRKCGRLCRLRTASRKRPWKARHACSRPAPPSAPCACAVFSGTGSSALTAGVGVEADRAVSTKYSTHLLLN